MKKGWMLFCAILLICFLVSQGEVSAKTLEELLLEKGAITEEEYKQLTQKETSETKPVATGLDEVLLLLPKMRISNSRWGDVFRHAILFLIMMIARTSVNFEFSG
jgi:hypothetical protein